MSHVLSLKESRRGPGVYHDIARAAGGVGVEGVRVKHVVRSALFLLAVVVASGFSAEQVQGANPTSMQCDIGPVAKTFGNSQWLVYSCSDGRTLLIVSAPGNPAMPFVFTLFPTDEGYRLSGEGTGIREVTSAALSDLTELSAKDIVHLLEQTRRR